VARRPSGTLANAVAPGVRVAHIEPIRTRIARNRWRFLSFMIAFSLVVSAGAAIVLAVAFPLLVYVFMRLPLLLSEGLTRDMLVLVAARVVTYGVVGIVGGELAGRTKYVFARFDANPLTDETTGVYNGRYAGAAIRSGVARWDRYQMPYSVVRLSLSPALATDLRPQRARHMVRQVASHIRNDIRLVDDLAHLGDGRFLVLFPNTGAAGAAVAGDRLHRGIVAMLDIEDAALEVSVCSTETDPVTLRKLAADLDPSPAAAGAPAGAGNGNAPGPEPQA
jgi:GGDEF domain-containing protein